MLGKVKWFNTEKGYGFITPEEGGKDVFVHCSALKRAGLAELKEGDRVRYNVERSEKGPNAIDLAIQ